MSQGNKKHVMWKNLISTMDTKCKRCGLRGEHVCLTDIRDVAQNRKSDGETASARVRMAGSER